ncbi:unnamed protein product, partial [Symbiodinium necroappetens]
RGFVLIPTTPNDGESDDAMRQRMQQCIRRVAAANITLGRKPDGNMARLWLTISQPPERRRRAALAGKVKRLIIEAGGSSTLPQIEPEWATGTVWFRDHKVSSGSSSCPPNSAPAGCGWIDLKTIAKLIGVPAGPHFDQNETWMLIHGKLTNEWRGCAVAFRKVLGTHEHTRILKAAITVTLRSPDSRTLGIVSGHISHNFTIAQTASCLADWDASPSLTLDRIILGMDANETFLHPGGHLGKTTLSCTGRGEQILQWCMEQGIVLPAQDIEQPSYYPYNTAMSPRRLDYIATRGIHSLQAWVGQHRDRASSDHADLHSAIANAAKLITVPVHRSLKFQESSTLKRMRRQARELKPGNEARQAWSSVHKTLQQERKGWRRLLADKAGEQNWDALRSLKKKDSKTNWADALLDDPAWSTKLDAHMRSIFCKAAPAATRSAMALLHAEASALCKCTPWRPFSEAEMRITMARWKNHRATGPDGIALEALRLMFEHPAWRPKIAELLNDGLYKGHLPPLIMQGASVLLPKCVQPLSWSDTRPITLSSALLKWTSQLLLLRG